VNLSGPMKAKAADSLLDHHVPEFSVTVAQLKLLLISLSHLVFQIFKVLIKLKTRLNIESE